MASLLIVAESAEDRDQITQLLAENSQWKLYTAASADNARSQLEQCGIDLLLLEMDTHKSADDLVPLVREQFPRVPILIIAPDNNHDALVKALVLGAASYVPRGRLSRELPATIKRLLALSSREYRRRLAECLHSDQCRMVVRSDLEMIPAVVGYLRNSAEDFGLCDIRDSFRMAVALEEALTNAVIHGNLEVGSELRAVDECAYAALLDRRLAEEPYRSRTVQVDSYFDAEEVHVVITDEGPGFDPNKVPDPTDPANLEKPHGRGLMLMGSFMDEVQYNDKGNQVTLWKRRTA